MARTLDMQDQGFELSQNYTYFYDQLEKSGRALSEAIARIEEPLDSPEMLRLLRQPELPELLLELPQLTTVSIMQAARARARIFFM